MTKSHQAEKARRWYEQNELSLKEFLTKNHHAEKGNKKSMLPPDKQNKIFFRFSGKQETSFDCRFLLVFDILSL